MKGKTFRRKIKNYGYDGININSYSWASVWDGQPVNASHYA